MRPHLVTRLLTKLYVFCMDTYSSVCMCSILYAYSVLSCTRMAVDCTCVVYMKIIVFLCALKFFFLLVFGKKLQKNARAFEQLRSTWIVPDLPTRTTQSQKNCTKQIQIIQRRNRKYSVRFSVYQWNDLAHAQCSNARAIDCTSFHNDPWGASKNVRKCFWRS